MSGALGVDTEISPRPENADIQAIQQAADLLGDPSTMREGLQILEQYRNRAGGNHSAVIDQIIGAGYFQLGQLTDNEEQRQRFFQRGRENLERAIQRFPNYRQAHKNLANLLFRNGMEQDARPHFIRAIELGDRDPITFGILAAIYYEAEQFSSAETAARNSLMLNPTQIEFRRILGLSLMQQERFDEARAVFEEILQERPNDAFYWQMISNTLVNTDRIDEAARVLEIVRFMGEAQPQTLLLLGDVYMNKNMVEDAYTAYREALEMTRAQRGQQLPPISTYIRPVESLNNFQAYQEAFDLLAIVEDTYRRNLTDDDRMQILVLRSEINLARGEAEEAARNLREILRSDPMNPRALLTLANYYGTRRPPPGLSVVEERQFRTRSVQRSIDLYQRAQELRFTGDDRNLEAARQAYIGEGQLHARERNLDQAISALRAAQQIREEARIGEYINMIQQVRQGR